MVGRAPLAFGRDFLAAIDLFLVFGCADRTIILMDENAEATEVLRSHV